MSLDKNGLSRDYNGFIATFSGGIIEPLNPDPEDILIEDIAHSLAHQCRFTGHTSHFYSVAQHSILVSELVPDELRLWGLLHDATEAYLADMARPIKHQPGFGETYRTAEDVLMRAIAVRFGLSEEFPMPKSVAEADNIVLGNEIRLLMPDHPIYNGWERTPWIRTGALDYMAPDDAEQRLLNLYHELGGAYADSGTTVQTG